jgi:hypothetical protein
MVVGATTVRLTNINHGAGEKSRTPDLRITNALLYQLSYAGVAVAARVLPREGRILAEPLQDRANEGSRFGTAAFFSVA